MSKVVSLLTAFICAVLFVNVYGQDVAEYGILTPEGTYKFKSGLNLAKVIKKLKDFTLPAGDAMIDQWIADLKVFDDNLKAGDYKAWSEEGRQASKALRALLPSIPDKIIYAAVESIPIKFEKELQKQMIAGTTTLAELDRFYKYIARVLLSAMSKTTPTAATLN